MSARVPEPWCPVSADDRHHWGGCTADRCFDCGWTRTQVGRARSIARRASGRTHFHGRGWRHDHRMLTRGQWWSHMWADHAMPKARSDRG
jgi:hypothetical protein